MITLLFHLLPLNNFKPTQMIQPDDRVAGLVKQMTLDEKLAYIGGTDGFYVRAVPRLGIPAFKMSDGPLGLRNDGPAPAYPAGVMLAATWDPSAAQLFGHNIGGDARARNVNYWLGPGVDINRIPQNGRNFEYLGEDPLLASQMVVPIIKAVQELGICCTEKHYAENDNENDRNKDSSDVDERTLHEIGLRPFEAGVKEGHVGSIMTSYNLVNGVHMSENPVLLNILKKDWGFDGVVMSDWGSTYSPDGPYKAGLDIEMPNGDQMSPEKLKPLIESGQLSTDILDDKVARILSVAERMGWLDEATTPLPPVTNYNPDDAALEIARKGLTLLQNKDHFLPLSGKNMDRILVIGPNAEPAVTGGGGSSYIQAHFSVGLVTAIKQVSPSTSVQQISPPRALPEIKDGLVTSSLGSGFKAEFFPNIDLSGPATFQRLEKTINHNWSNKTIAPGIGPMDFSVRWTGNFVPDHSGTYEIDGSSDDGMRAFINDQPVISMWQRQGETGETHRINLIKGTSYNVKIEYFQGEGEAIARFGIHWIDSNTKGELTEGLKRATTVIAYVGFNPRLESEGEDRPWTLPEDQQQLLNMATSLNKHVIIVLNAGAAVDLKPWVSKAAAIFDSYYPGENGDIAVAEAIFGKLNPSGHLPFVMPVKLSDLRSTGSYPAVDHHLPYKEGVFIGERGLDSDGIKPLFAFGEGLSYSKFNILEEDAASLMSNTISLHTLVKNESDRSGAVVLQTYVSFPKSSVPRPAQQLAGFQRSVIPARAMEALTTHILLQDLAFWDINTHNWHLDPGTYTFNIGYSATDIRSHVKFEVSQAVADQFNDSVKQ